MMFGRDDNAPWYEAGLKFSCTQCGNCCSGPPGYVWIGEEETAALAKHLDMTVEAFRKQYARRAHGRWTLDERWNARIKGYDCIFLRRDPDTGKAFCGVYKARPTQCRTWPFWHENLRSQASWDRASRGCPGMNRQTFYPVDEIRILRDRTPKG